jgi:hypothetical protein
MVAALPEKFTKPALAILALAVWGFLSPCGANAGTCRIYSEGTDTVQACDNGAYTVMDRHGRRRVYGTPNAGFERYPGQWLGGERACPLNSSWRLSNPI